MSDPQKNGIDIRKAMEILAARAPHQHDHDHDHDDDDGSGGGHNNSHGCHCGGGGDGGDPPETLRTMGQTIDLLAPTSSSSSSKTPATTPTTTTRQDDGTNNGSAVTPPITLSSSTTDGNNSKIPTSNDTNKKNNQEQIQEHLATMLIVDLLQTVLSSQSERVKTYRTYEQSLDRVLISGNLTEYPPACATATASFAVLSDTIRAVQQELERRLASAAIATATEDTGIQTTASTTDPGDKQQQRSQNHQQKTAEWKHEIQCIHKLQSLEREKLQLTAACHLERIREKNQREELKNNWHGSGKENTNGTQQQRGSEDGGGELPSSSLSSPSSENHVNNEGRILSLLQQGITTLQTKISVCTEQINDVLDDLRCALVEEMEEEEEK